MVLLSGTFLCFGHKMEIYEGLIYFFVYIFFKILSLFAWDQRRIICSVGMWWQCMMTSSNGNIFRVTGPLCGEFTGLRWIPPQRSVTWSFDVSLICAWLNGWVNTREAGDLRLSRPLWRHCNVCLNQWLYGQPLILPSFGGTNLATTSLVHYQTITYVPQSCKMTHCN